MGLKEDMEKLGQYNYARSQIRHFLDYGTIDVKSMKLESKGMKEVRLTVTLVMKER